MAVAFAVEDKGIGIPKKAQKNIFDKFYRVENAMIAKTRGHGLGLSIVKNMVELNNGSITLQSKPGKGTTFTVTFPALWNNFNENGTNLKTRKKSITDTTKAEMEQYVG